MFFSYWFSCKMSYCHPLDSVDRRSMKAKMTFSNWARVRLSLYPHVCKRTSPSISSAVFQEGLRRFTLDLVTNKGVDLTINCRQIWAHQETELTLRPDFGGILSDIWLLWYELFVCPMIQSGVVKDLWSLNMQIIWISVGNRIGRIQQYRCWSRL